MSKIDIYDEFNKSVNNPDIKRSMAESLAKAEQIEEEEREKEKNHIEDYKNWCDEQKPSLDEKFKYWIDYITRVYLLNDSKYNEKILFATSRVKDSNSSRIICTCESSSFYEELISYLNIKAEEINQNKNIDNKNTNKKEDIKSTLDKRFSYFTQAFVLYSEGKLYTEEQMNIINKNNARIKSLNIDVDKYSKNRALPVVGSIASKKLMKSEEEIKSLQQVSRNYADDNLRGFVTRFNNGLIEYSNVCSDSEFEQLIFKYIRDLIEQINGVRSVLDLSDSIDYSEVIGEIVSSDNIKFDKYKVDFSNVRFNHDSDGIGYLDNMANYKQAVIKNNNLIQALNLLVSSYLLIMKKYEKSDIKSMLDELKKDDVSTETNKKSSY